MWRKFLFILALIILIGGGIAGYYGYNLYQKIYAPQVTLPDEKEETFIHIPSGADIETVTDILLDDNLIKDGSSFQWTAELMNYIDNIHSGRYRIEDGMNNRELLNLLRSGKQEPVQLRLRERMTAPEIAGFFGQNLEADSARIMELLNDEQYLQKYDLNTHTAIALFLPDTYEFYWDIDAGEFVDRMYWEYQQFWTEEKREKAENLGFTPMEVTILASIVEAETYRYDEMPTIAGVYLNRLERGMKLQADPTVIFAIEDRNVSRVTFQDLQVDSPYNTYQNPGLPPGPIGSPGKRALEAVLNPEDHSYLYFCAKADFSGYHEFSETYSEHRRCARRYQHQLNQMGITN